jgi:hypothetical protein
MVAEAVEVLIATVCLELNVPAAGLKVGIAAAGFMVYAAEPTALAALPVATAIAWTNSLAEIVTGPE